MGPRKVASHLSLESNFCTAHGRKNKKLCVPGSYLVKREGKGGRDVAFFLVDRLSARARTTRGQSNCTYPWSASGGMRSFHVDQSEQVSWGFVYE